MKKIKLHGINGDGKYAIVDDKDYELFSSVRWFLGGNGYPKFGKRVAYKKMDFTMHNIVLGFTPKGVVADHINGNPLDNRRGNLRFCSPKENARNRRVSNGSLIGLMGVSHQRKKFRARITVDGKIINLGTFDTIEESALKYNESAKLYFGEFARLNDF